MPPVSHPKGFVPDEFQPRPDPKRLHFAMACCALAALLFGTWLGFLKLRKLLRKTARSQPIQVSEPFRPSPAKPHPAPDSNPRLPSK